MFLTVRIKAGSFAPLERNSPAWLGRIFYKDTDYVIARSDDAAISCYRNSSAAEIAMLPSVACDDGDL